MKKKRRPIGSMREVSPGKWIVEYKHGRNPLTGKPNRGSRTVYGSDRAAERALQKLVAEMGGQPSADMSLESFLLDVWLPYCEPPQVRQRTYDDYESKIRLYIIPFLGQEKLPAIGTYILARWLKDLAKLKRTPKPTKVDPKPEPRQRLSARTRLHAYRTLHNALDAAKLWKFITANPLDDVAAPEVAKPHPDTLTVDEFNDYLDAFEGHLVEPFVLIALGGGLRRSELAALDLPDLTLSEVPVTTPAGTVMSYEGSVRITRGYHERDGELWFEPPKSDDSRRVVALPGWCVARLMEVLGDRRFGPLVLEHGARVKPSRISLHYIRHVEKCGLRRIVLKNLRHTAATLELEAGVDLYTVSKRRGHSTEQVTRDYYLNTGTKLDREAAQKLGEIRQIGGSRRTAGTA